MRALVTGATGFVGSHLAEALVSRGAQVRCLIRPTSDRRWIRNLACDSCAVPDFSDGNSLQAAMEGIHTVYHVAGLVSSPRPAEFYETNHRLTVRLLDAAGKAGVRRFVLLSSIAACGPALNGRPVDEETPPHPHTPYGKSKRLAEEAALGWKDRLWTVILRPPAIYGARDRAFLEMARLIQLGLLPKLGWRTRRFCATHVSDVVEAILAAAPPDGGEPVPSGSVFFIGDDRPITHLEMARHFAAALGRRGIPFPIPGPFLHLAGLLGSLFGVRPLNRNRARMILADWRMSCARFRETFAWRPRVCLTDGIHGTVEWYRREGWLRVP